jgi:hypothetical protein
MNKNSPQTARRSAKAAKSLKTGRRTTKKTAKSTTKAGRATKPAAKSAARKSNAVTKPAANIVKAAANIVVKASIRAASEMISTLRTPAPPTQPSIASDLPSSRHKYQVGQAVYYTSPSFGRAAASGSYTVVKLLPSDGDDCQYRIKSTVEAFERVAKESQLEQV